MCRNGQTANPVLQRLSTSGLESLNISCSHLTVCADIMCAELAREKFPVLQGLESLDIACCTSEELISIMCADCMRACAELVRTFGLESLNIACCLATEPSTNMCAEGFHVGVC